VSGRGGNQSWDAIKTPGSLISIGYDAEVALQLSKEPDKNDVAGVCSSNGPLGKKRVL
jgi:hypothetical protein